MLAKYDFRTAAAHAFRDKRFIHSPVGQQAAHVNAQVVAKDSLAGDRFRDRQLL